MLMKIFTKIEPQLSPRLYNSSLLITNSAFASIFLLVIIRVVDAFHEDLAVVDLVRQSLLE